MSLSEICAELAEDLETLRGGAVSCEVIRLKYRLIPLIPELEAVICNLQHYLDDSDIRQSNSSYRVMQEAELDRLISILRSGEALDRAEGIDFLHKSG